MFDNHICPFYEEHSGEYYQGIWEFHDLCWCSPELGTTPNCYNGCFFIRNNEEAMLDTCISALDRKVEVRHYKKELGTFRDLTEGEKQNIIKDMETFMGIFNKRCQPSLIYK